MKKLSTKLLAVLICLSMITAAGAVSVYAAQGTSASLTKMVEYNGQEESFPNITRGAISAVENLPGKTADDKGLKLSITDGQSSAYAEFSVRDNPVKETSLSARTVTVDVYPNETVSAIQFRGSTGEVGELALSNNIPMSALRSGQWNKIVFLYNPNGKHSVYVNGVLCDQSQEAHITTIKWYANIRLYAHTEAESGAYLEIDNLQAAMGTAVMPAVTSGKYIIDSRINEYAAGETVGNLLENITYNGTAVAVKNASGEDITENIEAEIKNGDSVWVYDGDICTGIYYIGDSHKALVSNMSYAFDDGNTAGFTATSASISTENGTDYKKNADNKVMKMTASSVDVANYYAQINTLAEDRSKVSTISFEVYPNGTWQAVKIGSQYSNPFLSIPSKKLVQNEWNRITVYVGGDKNVRPNTAYVNGKQVFHEGNTADKIYIIEKQAVYNYLRLVAHGTISENSSVIVDDFYYAEGLAIVPSVASQKYVIEEVTINEFKNDTVADVKANITHNGSSMKIINASGADITNNNDAVIQSGDHLYIYDGEFVIAHYRFDKAHVAPVIINSHIDDFEGISAVNGACETKTAVNGKADTDTSLKLTADTSKASATTNIGTVYIERSIFDSASKSIPASAVSFEVYADDTIDEIVIAGRASNPNYEVRLGAVPASALAEGQWNRILFVYNKTGENQLYLNGKLYSSADSGHFASTVTYGNLRIKANYTKQDDVTPYVYIDELQTAYITEVNPEIKTDKYGVDGNLISGCLCEAATVKANIETSFGTNLVIKNPAGDVIEGDAQVAAGYGIYVYDGDMILSHYYAEQGKLIVNTPVITYSGTDANDTVAAEVTYADTVGKPGSFNIFIAAYAEDGSIAGVTVKRITTSGNDGVKTVPANTLTLTATAKEIKVIVMNDACKPLCNYGFV